MSPVRANRLLSSLSNKLQHFHNEPETPCSLFHYEEQFMFSLSLVILLLKYLLDSLFLERHIFQKNRYKSKLKRSELKDKSMLLSTSLKTQFWLVCLYHKIVTLLWPQYIFVSYFTKHAHAFNKKFYPGPPPTHTQWALEQEEVVLNLRNPESHKVPDTQRLFRKTCFFDVFQERKLLYNSCR